eukprot:gb/GECG01000096.1/.p1 GENE.gb/GECG01000096.1/~~gb/GECG01000096.1/.p1  ORF type:complete len:325 (+),score=35.18 gb/GECG01000096.1/:1-975(+)
MTPNPPFAPSTSVQVRFLAEICRWSFTTFTGMIHATFLYTEAFQSFHCPPRGKPVKCQFLVKAIQHVFRNLKGLECLRIYFGGSTQTQREGAARSEENSEDINTLILEAKCSHQILKRYSIACEDCELFRAVVNRDECPNWYGPVAPSPQSQYHLPEYIDCSLGRKPQGLARMIECVPIADEVCCGIANEKLYFKSIYGNASDAVASHGHLESAMSIPLNEFHRCELAVSELEVILPLKEFKAMLQFAEAKDVECEEVNMYLNEPGQPLLLSTRGAHSRRSFYADLVLATVRQPTEDNGDEQRTQDTTPRNEKRQRDQGISQNT